jgi:hypothetical protein
MPTLVIHVAQDHILGVTLQNNEIQHSRNRINEVDQRQCYLWPLRFVIAERRFDPAAPEAMIPLLPLPVYQELTSPSFQKQRDPLMGPSDEVRRELLSAEL